MHEDPVRNINPNTLYGCHPLDFRSKLENHPCHLIVKQPEAPLPKVSSRLRLLEKIDLRYKQLSLRQIHLTNLKDDPTL